MPTVIAYVINVQLSLGRNFYMENQVVAAVSNELYKTLDPTRSEEENLIPFYGRIS